VWICLVVSSDSEVGIEATISATKNKLVSAAVAATGGSSPTPTATLSRQVSMNPSKTPPTRLTAILKLEDAFVRTAGQTSQLFGLPKLAVSVPSVGKRACEILQAILLHPDGVSAVRAASNYNKMRLGAAGVSAGEVKAMLASILRVTTHTPTPGLCRMCGDALCVGDMPTAQLLHQWATTPWFRQFAVAKADHIQWEIRSEDGIYTAVSPLENVVIEHAYVTGQPFASLPNMDTGTPTSAVVFLPSPVMKVGVYQPLVG
jgi:hypothetical protein